MVTATEERWGRLDVLYHNAIDVAFVNREDRCIVDLPEAVWDDMQRIALTGRSSARSTRRLRCAPTGAARSC
jgi:NAD(P)-dependent dehydrogenase (short-subunit alcohol dehydrogenase family)